MKRYAVFAGDTYYPGGGWDDFQNSFDTISKVSDYIETTIKNKFDWWQTIDLQTGEEVELEIVG